MVGELIPKVGKHSVSEQEIATCYAVLGDRDEFFKWIDKAISAKRISTASLRFSSFLRQDAGRPAFP